MRLLRKFSLLNYRVWCPGCTKKFSPVKMVPEDISHGPLRKYISGGHRERLGDGSCWTHSGGAVRRFTWARDDKPAISRAKGSRECLEPLRQLKGVAESLPRSVREGLFLDK